ncbi:CesT family type III secretion system chaperone [Pseudomonas entomophila]|uniref:CesT family type III secretion system chaperone n=1 Tax=Pseudomonas entomophila TaxID=312306 RepID=UPI001F01C8CE|nr:CesT family type III secretion system chaperone [Pseudomonas entomophila]MCG8291422.1 CesT family type III secretion system chaperone [Pseudomonas entomophila]
MNSVFYISVVQLHERVGLAYNGEASQIDCAINIDGVYSVRMTECSDDYLVMSATLCEVVPSVALSLMKRNLVQGFVGQYVLAITECGDRLVVWRGVNGEALKHTSLLNIFDAFADYVDALLEELKRC